MSKLVVENAVCQRLSQVQDRADLYDPSDRLVGHFLTHEAYLRLLDALNSQDVTDEELEQARRQPGGLTTAEVRTRLAALTRSEQDPA